MKSLFIVDGPLDRPILHSQGLPLINRLSSRKISCYILSFEDFHNASNPNLQINLKNNGINWIQVGSIRKLSGFQRIQNIISGFFQAFQLCKREKISVVHCRSYRPAVIGSFLKTILGCGYIFDMRGFLIDEQIMLGRWKAKGLVYYFARSLERWCILNADIIITNTTAFRNAVIKLNYFPVKTSSDKVVIIPNSVDTQRFLSNHPNRLIVRTKMKWQERVVFIFAGEARDWEAFEQIIMLFKEIKPFYQTIFLALICYGNLTELRKLLAQSNISRDDYCLETISPEQMPEIMGAADIGVLFRKNNVYTKTVSSPIKFAEYLSCGLPVIINSGIGDTTSIIEKYKVGAIVDPEETKKLRTSVLALIKMVNEDPNLRQRCHAAAEKELSLDLSEDLYFQAYSSVSAAAEKRMKR
jgi:glycosyltransferase involved in cell wall biosynthesis